MKWTDEQYDAITIEGTNVIVSAAAGSGKTAVLTERVIKKLEKGTNINELLILTFTKLAAFEMKERIRKKLLNIPSLSKQLELLDTAYITTFDSFALSLVKKYHYYLNLPKDIDIIDSNIINIKKNEIIDNIFEEYYQEENELFLKLINNFCIKDDIQIKKSIINIYNKISSLVNKDNYLDTYFDNYYSDTKINENIKEFTDIMLDKIGQMADLTYQISELDDEYYNKLETYLDNLYNATNYDEIKEYIDIKLPNVPNGSSDELKEVKSKVNDIYKEIKSICVYVDTEDIIESINLTRDNIKIIIEIIKRLDKEILDYKNKHYSYEFNDIALTSLKLIKNHSNVVIELKNTYQEILIDEYQDTNDIQEEFVKTISNNNIYMVGDIKQSIYKFRNANSAIFLNKYNNYKDNINGKKIDLFKNFRSREEVINDINTMFLPLIDDYENTGKMNFGNNVYIPNNQNNNLEIYNYDYDKDTLYSKEEIEIFTIAKDIKDKIDNKYQIIDKNTNAYRDITYKDIVILIDRSTNFDLFKKIFVYLNIPLTIIKDEKLNVGDDILVINNLIKFILKVKDNEIDVDFKYLFMSVMRSFLFSNNDDIIFNYFLNKNFKDSKLYQISLDIANNIDNMSNKELLDRIINDFNYYENLIKIGNINNNIIKLNKLYSLIDSLTNLEYNTYDLSNYLDTIIKNNYIVSYSINDNNTNSVKIMTIHKSKGLEFSICYYPFLYKSFNIMDIKDKFLMDNTYGIITPYFRQGIGETILKYLVKNKYMKDEIEEKIRLFYVALTRSKEKMILIMPNIESYNKNSMSFKDIILNNINIGKYLNLIDIDSLNITNEYNLTKKDNYIEKIDKTKDIIKVENINNFNSLIDTKTFSKHIFKLNTKEEYKNILYGKAIHNKLELSNIMDNSKLLKHNIFNNIKDANIYKEYEFIYIKNNIKYHGIIDLMLEYDKYIDIIDYKLSDITDSKYIEQLNGYKDYIYSITKKDINLYLYSIINDELIEINKEGTKDV